MLKLLSRVKENLEIPLDDNSEDGRLGELLEATTELILELTGWATVDQTARQDIFHHVKRGRSVYLTQRPVSAVTLAEAKFIGEAFGTIETDLVDSTRGKLALHSGASGWPPPQHYNPNGFLRWREREWDVIRVTYNVTGTEPPARIKAAIIQQTVWSARQVAAGVASSSGIAGLTEQYRTEGLPNHVEGLIAGYIRDDVSWVA